MIDICYKRDERKHGYYLITGGISFRHQNRNLACEILKRQILLTRKKYVVERLVKSMLPNSNWVFRDFEVKPNSTFSVFIGETKLGIDEVIQPSLLWKIGKSVERLIHLKFVEPIDEFLINMQVYEQVKETYDLREVVNTIQAEVSALKKSVSRAEV